MDDNKFLSKIDSLVDFFNSEFQTKLGKRLETVMIVGSYAQGKLSLDRPDINYVIIWKERGTADDYLELGKILADSIQKFLEDFVVRPEFRPYKFSYPAKRKDKEVFVNISCLNYFDKHNNFFIPDFVLDGFYQTRKIIFGYDVLANIDITVTKKSVVKNAIAKLSSHKVQLDRIPLVYNINKDSDLIFNESLDHGKNLAYFGVELLMTDKQIRDKEYLTIINDKQKLKEFYSRCCPPALASINTILNSRNNYEKWKNDKIKAIEVYKAAFLLHNLLQDVATLK